MADPLPNPPHIYGPTWQKMPDGSWHLPEYTLGYGVIDWMSRYINSPAGANDADTQEFLLQMGRRTNAFVPTHEQFRFILWWYAVNEDGTWVYSSGILRRLKGWGKDPFSAALALAELCGPVRISHWEAGQPVGQAAHAAWVTCAAVSQDQTKNTFSLFPVMISKEMKRDYGLDVNKFLIYSSAGGRIEAATSSPASMEGNRPTFVIQNEIQWWGAGPDGKANDGHGMEEVIEGNITKIPSARVLSICNAHIPGNDTVGERYHDAAMRVLAGEDVDVGTLYDALEAPADTPVSEIPSQKEDPDGHAAGVEALRQGVLVARGDSIWLPVDEIVKSILNTKNSITESRRKFLNQVNASEDSWIAPSEWDRLALTEPMFALKKGDRIALGFDGSKSNDWTALVACRIHDGVLFLIKAWNPANFSDGQVPKEDVDEIVRSMFVRYDVVAFRADVKEFESYVDQWSRDFKRDLQVMASPNNPVAFDMRGQSKRFSFDCDRFLDAVLEKEVYHDGNPTLRHHITNAHRHPTQWDTVSIRKASKDSKKKIDAAVCAVLAYGARHDFMMSKKHRSGSAVVIRR